MMKKILILMFLAAVFSLVSCEYDPLFTDIVESNLTVIVKGNFESNTATGWSSSSPNPDYFMLDIAEMKMNNDGFAPDRWTYKALLNTSDPFFSGEGVTYKCNDLVNGKIYTTLKIYFRKMIFNNATELTLNDVTTVFREKDVAGFDFNEYQIYTQTDYDNDNLNNLVFPLNVQLPYAVKYDRNKHYVLEVRLFVRNNIKAYSGNHGDLPNTFYAFDDTIATGLAGVSTIKYIGGNVRVGVNMYATDEVATITSLGGGTICAVEAGKNPEDYLVPPIVTTNGTLENVPIGKSWDIYRLNSTTITSYAKTALGNADLTSASNGTVVSSLPYP